MRSSTLLLCYLILVRKRIQFAQATGTWRYLLILLITFLFSQVALRAQPYLSNDTPPSCYEIDAHVRNGISDYEGALYTPSTPYIGQPGGTKWKMNPAGKPVWNSNGNRYGDIHSFLFTYNAGTGTTGWNIDFNRDGDYADYKESVTNVAPTLVGKGFQYINLLAQGNVYGMTVNVTDFTINGLDFGSYASSSNTPVSVLFEDTSGIFNDIVVTGHFSFSGSGSTERPRIWIQLGESNIAPTCTLTSPVTGSEYITASTITLAATALDPTGKIDVVEFYDGDYKICEDATSPYTCQWSNIPSGVRTLRAKAIDHHEAFAISSPVFIIVSGDPIPPPPPGNGPYIVSPINGSILYDPDTIKIVAAIVNPLDSAYRMEFFRDDTSLGIDSMTPYVNTSLLNPAMGAYTIKVKSTDQVGIVSESDAVNFTVRCIREDINIDGVVNTIDFLLLLSAYGTNCTGGCPADFNDDRVVSAIDFLRLLAVFRYSCL